MEDGAASFPRTATAAHVVVASSAETCLVDAAPAGTDVSATGAAIPTTFVSTVTIDSTHATTVATAAMADLHTAETPLGTSVAASSTVATSYAVQSSVAGAQASGECGKVEPMPPQTMPPHTMSELLDSASAHVEKMEEAKFMCRHVLKRIEDANDRSPPILGDGETPLLKIAREFVAFLSKFANETIGVYRLIHCRTVVARVRGFHNDIDNLDNLPRDASGFKNNWESNFAACRKTMQDKFDKMSQDKLELCSVKQTTAAQQCTALTLVTYELEHVKTACSKEELGVLEAAFNTLSRFSKNTMKTVEPWFLPPYEIQIESEKYSFGSFAEVYLAKFLGAQVVVKVPTSQNDKLNIDAFRKEADTWFLANKIPHVVRFLGAYHFGTKPYFVSEFAENGTLICFVKTHEKGPGMVWKLLLEAAYGLKGIHQLGIVHNDLKCNNILVTGDFKAKLTDFGLSSFAAANIAEGAYKWKSPEVFEGSNAYKRAQEAVANGTVTASALAQASDVYSFGMCIWEAVTQGQPWGAMKDVAVKSNLANGKLPDTVKGFSAEQWALVKDMCMFEPTNRISIDSAIGRLKKFADDERNVQLAALKRETSPSPPAATVRASESVTVKLVSEPGTALDVTAVSLEIAESG